MTATADNCLLCQSVQEAFGPEKMPRPAVGKVWAFSHLDLRYPQPRGAFDSKISMQSTRACPDSCRKLSLLVHHVVKFMRPGLYGRLCGIQPVQAC